MTEVPQIQLSDGLVSLNGSIKLATYAVNDDGTQDLAAVFSLVGVLPTKTTVCLSRLVEIKNRNKICLSITTTFNFFSLLPTFCFEYISISQPEIQKLNHIGSKYF